MEDLETIASAHERLVPITAALHRASLCWIRSPEGEWVGEHYLCPGCSQAEIASRGEGYEVIDIGQQPMDVETSCANCETPLLYELTEEGLLRLLEYYEQEDLPSRHDLEDAYPLERMLEAARHAPEEVQQRVIPIAKRVLEFY